MKISAPRIKQMLTDYQDAQYGQYVDLEMLLDHLSETRPEMDGEEAALRFLYELSKIYN